MRLFLSITAAVAVLGGAALAQAAKPASTGIFNTEQAEHGAELYASRCVACHGAALEGSDVNPSLSGPRFLGAWVGQPVSELTTRIRTTMPLDDPGSLGQADAAAIAAAILQANGYPTGEAEMPASASGLAGYVIDAPPRK
jgi:quinoprotein glucose dehydrogenase